MRPQKILVVRNDKLGDFMLAWPTFALIKKHWPEVHVTALVPKYTAPIAKACPWIDELLIDSGEGTWNLSKNFSALVTLFSTGRVALAGLIAGIPYRLAPATKIAQLGYNHRLTQRRSRSEKPEYRYNIDLGYQLLQDFGKVQKNSPPKKDNDDLMPIEISRPLLNFDGNTTTHKNEFLTSRNLVQDTKLIFIHPGSGGSANNLSIEQFAQLALTISEKSTSKISFVITAGPGEEDIAKKLVKKISATHPAILFQSDSGIEGFARTLQIADLFISGSTGTLHIAGAMDLNTAGFYPRHRSATPLRWQTLNSPEHRLSFTPPDGAVEDDLSTIDIDAAASSIVEHYFTV